MATASTSGMTLYWKAHINLGVYYVLPTSSSLLTWHFSPHYSLCLTTPILTHIHLTWNSFLWKSRILGLPKWRSLKRTGGTLSLASTLVLFNNVCPWVNGETKSRTVLQVIWGHTANSVRVTGSWYVFRQKIPIRCVGQYSKVKQKAVSHLFCQRHNQAEALFPGETLPQVGRVTLCWSMLAMVRINPFLSLKPSEQPGVLLTKRTDAGTEEPWSSWCTC